MTNLNSCFGTPQEAPLAHLLKTVEKLPTVKEAAATSPEILTVAEVAVRLRCSKAHVCNLINGKVKGVMPLPAIRPGRRMLVRAAALQTWLAENEREGML